MSKGNEGSNPSVRTSKGDNMAEEQMHDTDVEAKKAKHYVAFILDRSSSMRSYGAEAVDGFNQQIDVTKKQLEDKDMIEPEVCLVTFSSMVDAPEIWCRPLNEITPWDQEEYRPSGMTALYDAMGFTINKLKQQPDINDPTTSVLLIVVTDGEENSSREYDAARLQRLIDEVQDTGRWTIVYEGANVDLTRVSKSTNIQSGNMINFVQDTAGFANAVRRRQVGTQYYYDTVTDGIVQATNGADSFTLNSSDFYGTTSNTTTVPNEDEPDSQD